MPSRERIHKSTASKSSESERDKQQTAKQGVSGSGGSLPHFEELQESFGPIDLSPVKSYQDTAAKDAAQALWAKAFTHRGDVAFGSPPSLYTAAHETAHAVMQRAGVSPPGGFGSVGDRGEQQADAVASAVVRGQPVQSYFPANAAAAMNAPAPVQATQLLRFPANPSGLAVPASDAKYRRAEELVKQGFDTDELTSEEVQTLQLLLWQENIKVKEDDAEGLRQALWDRGAALQRSASGGQEAPEPSGQDNASPSQPAAPQEDDDELQPTESEIFDSPAQDPELSLERLQLPDKKFEELQQLAQELIGKPDLKLVEKLAIEKDGLLAVLAQQPGGLLMIDAIFSSDTRFRISRRKFAVKAFKEVFGTELKVRTKVSIPFSRKANARRLKWKEWGPVDLRKAWRAFRTVPMHHTSSIGVMARNPGTMVSNWTGGSGERGTLAVSTLLPSHIGMKLGNAPMTAGRRLPLIGKRIPSHLKGDNEYSSQMKAKNAFQMTVLHEIGHAVDGKLRIMENHKGTQGCGAWRKYSSFDEVLDEMLKCLPLNKNAPQTSSRLSSLEAEHAQEMAAWKVDDQRMKQLTEGFENLGTTRRGQQLHHAVEDRQKASPEYKDLQKRQQLNAARRADLQTARDMEKERLKVEARGIPWNIYHRLKNGQRIWRTPAGPVRDFVEMIETGRRGWVLSSDQLTRLSNRFNGRIYHSDDIFWYSYSAEEREKNAVSTYQWKTPSEWFAELYAHYYMGTLKGTQKTKPHPLVGWLEEILKDPEARPEANPGPYPPEK